MVFASASLVSNVLCFTCFDFLCIKRELESQVASTTRLVEQVCVCVCVCCLDRKRHRTMGRMKEMLAGFITVGWNPKKTPPPFVVLIYFHYCVSIPHTLQFEPITSATITVAWSSLFSNGYFSCFSILLLVKVGHLAI